MPFRIGGALGRAQRLTVILDKARRFVLDLSVRPNMHRRKVSRHADR
jgi:hypothetical protein